MMSRITIGGILAGLVMFFWSFIAHMVLPIGYMGISVTPGEDTVLAALKANNAGSGLYIMPGNDYFQSLSKSSAEQQAAMKAMSEKAKTSGWAMIVYHPDGGVEFGPRPLLLQLFSQCVVCWIFAFALWAAMPRIRSFVMRVWLVSIMGLLPFVGSDFPSWNWYGYPGMYMVGKVLDYGLGAVLAGIFLAWWLARGEAPQQESARMAA
jgi:hypothetical protein